MDNEDPLQRKLKGLIIIVLIFIVGTGAFFTVINTLGRDVVKAVNETFVYETVSGNVQHVRTVYTPGIFGTVKKDFITINETEYEMAASLHGLAKEGEEVKVTYLVSNNFIDKIEKSN